MKNKIEQLCSEMLINVQTESDTITQQIKSFYDKNNKDKKLTENTFLVQIADFNSKYLNASAGLVMPKEEGFDFIDLDNDCSKKLKVIVNNFVNYIEELE